MNPHDEIADDPKDEAQIASVLKAANTDAAPPDPAALAKLRAQSTEAFAAASAPAPVVRTWRAARWLAAAAGIAIVAVGLYFWLAPTSVALGEVLDNFEKAETVHVRFELDGKKGEFWHESKSGRSRWDDREGHYRIADGDKFWIVNESANQAQRTNPPPFAKRPLRHFLEMLGVPPGNTAIRTARPVERKRVGDAEILVYRVTVAVPKGKDIVLETRADAGTWQLLSVLVLPANEPFEKFRLGELRVVTFNRPIAADKFVIADTLTEDGRIGKVTDVQGIVAVKPVLGERWTPVREGLVLRPGDWVRTDARGANATALRLVKSTGVILGPKTLVELVGPKQIRVIEGEVEITPTAGTTIELTGPGLQRITVKGRQFFRVEKQHLARVDKAPPWLLGFKGATTSESLGSLVALVDGRNVPLTVGYHKVKVDIRDQIARTVIEESFVNHTDNVLEGVFHFPLPADASISGFGMWIGNELVEADVVEKQRAREIYETILRERRDPGLLEWSGGNLFKARVYPIPARSEKRIKITYTQVLPMKGSRYRYSYALQSELLQQHPLRRLDIDVKVNSVVPLKSVTSPTHPTRDERTPHSAHVEFTAQEYTPMRDFEVVVETEGRQSDVVMIPHRRGEDGYFMLQLTPPGAAGNWDRPLLPNGEPLHLLILADTSASIDAGQRATQATFIASLLAALTPKDTFNLAVSDVTCDWAFVKAMPADADNVSAAREFLAKRSSLGWTDLDVAFAAVLKQCKPNTQVIYVGDGIVTTGDADPVAFTKRLPRLIINNMPGVKKFWIDPIADNPHLAGVKGLPFTFHAVTLGSSYESGVLKAIGSLGSGSIRKITSEQGPATIARELLGEIAQPGLRDIKVEFKGFKAARVYPDSLTNLPVGTQQILLGRYLPQGKDQAGEVIVTGTQGSKPVKFTTRAVLKDAEQGNSFIPRLWARMHLDALLEQGATETIKDEIIALSEEYQIITPYTSFLVLETDADRERFKVKRRFLMRDGERFFADGRDNAVFDLAQKQMKKAGDWRTALRRSVLSELTRLGREPRLFQPRREYLLRQRREPVFVAGNFVDLYDRDELYAPRGESLGDVDLGLIPMSKALSEEKEDWYAKDKDSEAFGFPDEGRKELMAAEPLGAERSEPDIAFPFPADALLRELAGDESPSNEFAFAKLEALDFKSDPLEMGEYFGRMRRGPSYGQWLNTLFPALPAAPRKSKDPKSTWPAAVRDLAKSLLRNDKLAKMAGGIEIVRQTETFETRWGERTGLTRRLELASAKAWFTRSASDGGQTLVSWCDAKEIGVYSRAFQLGRARASTPGDLQPPPLELSDHSLSSLELSYARYKATLEPQGKDRVLLVLKQPHSPLYETRILIDTARHVILSSEDRFKGKATHTIRFEDFVEAAGAWWARRVETLDGDGKRLSLATQSVKTLTQDELDKQMKAELADRAQVQLLHLPLPSVVAAKKALAAGKAGFAEHFILALHFLHSQQWPRVLDHLQQGEKIAAAKPGLRWLRSAILHDSRRHDELRKRYQADATRIAKDATAEAYFQAEYIVGQSGNVLQANEMLVLLDSLKPLYDKQPTHVQAGKRRLQLRVSYLSQAGRTDEALQLQKQLATDYPRDYSAQQRYAQALADAGDYPAAYAWLTRVLVKESKWLDWEDESLRSSYTRLLEQQGRFADLVKYTAAWIELNPAGRSAYEQHLSALIRSDEIEKADALALRWLKDAQVPGELAPPVEGRLSAAVYLMFGNGHQLWTNRVEERWLAPLSQAALFFARHETHSFTAEQIVGNHQFARSEEARKLRKAFAGILSTEIDKLRVEQVRRFVGWVQLDDAEPAAWNKIVLSLRQRWTKEAKDDDKHELGRALVTVLSRQESAKELLSFLRLQRETGPDDHRAEYANQLFDSLLSQPWSLDFEAEAFTLFDKLSSAEEPGQRLFASVSALHRLTDRLVENRIAAQTKLLEHPEKLTRTDLLKKQDEIRKQARTGVADRLRQEAGKHPRVLAQWLVAERIYLDVVLERNLKEAANAAWDYLGAAPPPKGADEPSIERALDELLRQRYLVTATNLAARKGADSALVERLVKYHDQRIQADDARGKIAKSRLFIALDRLKDLEQSLRQWTRDDDADSRWRVMFGYLLAEQGRLAEAIREFEAVETADELSPSAYRSLADWYLVQNQREAHDKAAAAVYKTMPEYQLSRLIAAKLQPWQRRDGHLPTELDKEVLRQFAVLFDKSARPQAYLHQLQQFYQASHDFRLLSGLPDGLLGHSAARVYPFVASMRSVLDEVRDEATADEIVKRIGEVRPRAKTDVDRRALDLLEVLVERRAGELVNQPGPHKEKALAALVRASKEKWSPGEPRLMADFLAALGTIAQKDLADEQLRQLKALHAEAAPGTLDQLHIAHSHAVTLHGYKRAGAALDLLEAALGEFQTANGGILPVTANYVLTEYTGLLEKGGHFARGEKVLLDQLKHPAHVQQRRWLTERLDHLYHHALKKDGDVSLGKGPTLYQSLHVKLQKDLADPDQNHRYWTITLLCSVYHTATEKKLPGVAKDVKTFAFEVMPPILKQQTSSRESLVSNVAETVRRVVGTREGIEFLLNEIDAEPRWLRYNNQDGWTRHGWTLGDWRWWQPKDLGPVEARLLKLVLAELRRDLESREGRTRAMYHRHAKRNTADYFWKEKADDFAKTAETVLAERGKSGASVQYIADYFYHGLDRPKRAIEILFVAHKQKLLDDEGQAKLVDFLHEQKRHGESIAVLEPLVERRPENLTYRVQLMHAYFKTDRPADLLALLKQTDAFFHEKNRWGESALARLAQSTLDNELFEKSVAYYKELIPLHERTQPNRGVGNGTLSNYYSGLAEAYAGLKKTSEAVEAAGGAVVAWGPRHEERAKALDLLKSVLLRSPDLDAFVAGFDKAKQDSPIVRKAIAQAYLDKKAHAKAVKQLELAAALQPSDAELYPLLIAAHDELGDKAAALKVLLDALTAAGGPRRDLKLYQKLGERYQSAGQAQEAERAYTSIVEMQATEAESHALLAEVRQKQDRWREAIGHWEQVAKLRALEPTGLLKLAAAQIHEKQWDAARETLRKLETRTWPTRFDEELRKVGVLKEKLAKKSG